MTKRIIKFRAWDKNKNLMYTAEDWLMVSGDGDRYVWNMGKRLREKDFILMQFTGLHDKNGKEIWEGDIVSFPDTESECVDTGVGMTKVAETHQSGWGAVVMLNAAWGIAAEGRPESLKAGFNSFEYITEDYGFEMKELEVIGNIYENPELLTN